MNLYNEMVELSKKINQTICESGIWFDDEHIGDRHREMIKIDLAQDEKAVLVLGVNPSVNKGNGELEYPDINFLKAVHCDQRKGKAWAAYTNQYHQERYNYFFKGFSMMWEKEEYLVPYLEKYTKVSSKAHQIKDVKAFREQLDSHKCHSKNYVIFADLLNLKVTDSSFIKPFLGQEKQLRSFFKKNGWECQLTQEDFKALQDDIFKLFQLQLAYYKPKLVWINFKELRVFLESYLSKDGIAMQPIYQRTNKRKGQVTSVVDTIFEANYQDTIIYFSSFFSQGGMTVEEKQCLKEAIDQKLEALDMKSAYTTCPCMKG